MRIETIPIAGFGGLDLDRHPFIAGELPDGRVSASTATNVRIDQISREIVKSQGSSVLINTTPATGETVLGMFEYRYQSGQRVFIVRSSTGFYKLDAGLTTYSELNNISGLAGGVARVGESLQIPVGAQIGRHLVVVDGAGSYYWDGEAADMKTTRLLEAPVALSSNGERPKLEITNTASTMTASHLYSVMMTFYNGTVDSPPLPCGSIRTEASNKCIKLSTGYGIAASGTGDGVSGEGTGRAATPNGATHIRVWVQGHTATDTKYYLFASEVVNPAGSVGDEITINITTPATTTELPTFQGAPGGCAFVCEHGGRAFYTGSPGWPVRLWYSEAGQPFRIKGTSWIDVGEFSDPVVGLFSFRASTPLLGILKRSSVWSLGGFDDASFLAGLQPVDENSGCIAPHAVRRIGNAVLFCGSGGVYLWEQNGKPVEISSPMRSRWLEEIRGAA